MCIIRATGLMVFNYTSFVNHFHACCCMLLHVAQSVIADSTSSNDNKEEEQTTEDLTPQSTTQTPVPIKQRKVVIPAAFQMS